MQRVTGIGGIFFKARDPVALRAWYAAHLGLDMQAWGGAAIASTDASGAPIATSVLWTVSGIDGTDLEANKQPFTINYRVADLDALLAALRSEGCDVLDRTDDSAYGKFGWVTDPEGNKVELWQPPAGQ